MSLTSNRCLGDLHATCLMGTLCACHCHDEERVPAQAPRPRRPVARRASVSTGKRGRPPKTRLAPEQRAQVKVMLTEAVSISEIARRMGVSRDQIRTVKYAEAGLGSKGRR